MVYEYITKLHVIMSLEDPQVVGARYLCTTRGNRQWKFGALSWQELKPEETAFPFFLGPPECKIYVRDSNSEDLGRKGWGIMMLPRWKTIWMCSLEMYTRP